MADSLSARRKKRWRRAIVAGLLCILVPAVAALVNNNFSIRKVSPDQFRADLQSAIERGTNWIDVHATSLSVKQPNSALLHMIRDMAELSDDQRLREISAQFLRTSELGSSFGRLVDPSLPFRPPAQEELDDLVMYQRWILHALDPDAVPLTPQDRSDMFSESKFRWGSLSHQLFAVYVWRRQNHDDKNVDALIDTLCQRVATEAACDFRVTDAYLQRIAFILAAGHPDLIRPRWVERILAYQHDDGGWIQSWYGWGPRLFQFHVRPIQPDSHATVQGVWVLYQLWSRYPDWIDQHYGTLRVEG